MMINPILALGLAGVFGAILLLLGALGVFGGSRAEVASTLQLAEAMTTAGTGRAAVAPHGRAAVPRLLLALARRVTGQATLEKIMRRLDMAGNPSGWTLDRVLVAKAAGMLGGAAFGLFVGRHSLVLVVVLAAGLGAFGFLLPNILLYNSALHRQEEVRRGLADALDLLVISVEAGLGFDAALRQVAINSDGPLAAEFGRMLQEVQMGKTRAGALEALAERTGVPDVQIFVRSIVQADALGIPVARVLHEQANQMRVKRRQYAEERAQKVPVKIMVPLVLFIMPALFIVVIGPGALKIMQMFSSM